MFEFILNLWIMRRVTVATIDRLVTLKRITADEATTIKETPQEDSE